MKYRFSLRAAVASAAVLAAGVATAQPAARLEVRFCPSAQVRTYPLESRRGVQGLLLQNLAVINRGDAPASITSLEIDLMTGSAVIDSRRLIGADLAAAAAAGPRLQGAGVLAAMSFQFCGDALVPPGVKLATGPMLAPGEALLVAQQPFAFKGARDRLQVRVEAGRGGQAQVAGADIPIVSAPSATPYRFPLPPGRWWAGAGPTPHTGHRWGLPEEFAFDIVALGDGTRSFRGAGDHFADYYVYGTPVLAAAPGVVVAVANDTPEDLAVLRRPGEADDAYAARQASVQGGLIAKGEAAVAGDYVLIDHGGGEYSLSAHLKPGSVRVHPGDRVTAGQPIAQVGSSGNSTEPHLHFQVCDAPRLLSCAGVPVSFSNVTLPFADYPRAVQSGDVVEVR